MGILLENKVIDNHNSAPYIIRRRFPVSNSDRTWYTVWSDGWVEQGGEFETTNGWSTVSLPIKMANKFYTVQVTRQIESGTDNISINVRKPASTANTSDTLQNFEIYITGNDSARGVMWVVYGKAANSELTR